MKRFNPKPPNPREVAHWNSDAGCGIPGVRPPPGAASHEWWRRLASSDACRLSHGAAPGDTALYTHLQSRRDCVLQPRVGRNELPWVMAACAPQLLRSCAINTNNTMPQSLRVGLLIREVGATSSRLRGVVPEISQGSSLLATLGFIAGSLWDSRSLASIKILVRCSGDGRTPVIPRNLELKVWRFSGCWMLELGVFIFA